MQHDNMIKANSRPITIFSDNQALQFLRKKSNAKEISEIIETDRVTGWRMLSGKTKFSDEQKQKLVDSFKGLKIEMFFK